MTTSKVRASQWHEYGSVGQRKTRVEAGLDGDCVLTTCTNSPTKQDCQVKITVRSRSQPQADLSYALLREVLYTRTTQVNRRVQGRLTWRCPDEELPHRCSRGVRRDQGTTSAHAQTRHTPQCTHTSDVPKSHFRIPELRSTARDPLH